MKAMPLSGAFRLRVAAALLLLVAARLAAQEYRFQFLGADQGLTNLAIKNLYQDRKGFLWVSTENGIFRYDGYRFRAFGAEEGIPSSSGVAFGEAPDGALLAGGEIGLFRLVANHFFEKIPLPGGAVVSWAGRIKSDSRGRTWLATDAGLMVLTESSAGALTIRTVAAPLGLTDKSTRGMLLEHDNLWYGCALQLCRSVVIMGAERTIVYDKRAGRNIHRPR